MSTIVRFSPDLGSWLVQHLDRGSAPAELVRTMIGQGMPPRAAQAIVNAFVTARATQVALPVDRVEMTDADDDRYDPPIMLPGARLQAGDRSVPVLMRSRAPVLAVLGDVLSAEECAQLIALARPRLKPSTVLDPASGQDVIAEHRSSLGMFFRLAENAFIERLDRRISALMNLPMENGEGLQVLHYPAGAENTAHFDFLQPCNAANQASIARSGQRVSTLLVYLNAVEQGGETVFPEAGWTVSPVPGNATYFEYCNRSGQLDTGTLHGSLPVQRGEKWVATKWMRERRFVPAGSAGSDGMMR